VVLRAGGSDSRSLERSGFESDFDFDFDLFDGLVHPAVAHPAFDMIRSDLDSVAQGHQKLLLSVGFVVVVVVVVVGGLLGCSCALEKCNPSVYISACRALMSTPSIV
jgi:hypothetical protein